MMSSSSCCENEIPNNVILSPICGASSFEFPCVNNMIDVVNDIIMYSFWLGLYS